MTTTTVRLVRLDAPPFWTRWDVTAPDGARLGRVEKRGMSSAWTAYGSDLRPLRHYCRTRADAVAAVTDAA